jgi:signal transduction histidine kinase
VSAPRLVVVSTDAVFATAVRDIFSAQLPGAATETLDAGNLKTRPIADGVVMDGRGDSTAAAALAARLRAMGFAGALAVVTDGAGDSAAAFTAAGAGVVRPAELASGLVTAFADQLERSGGEHAAEVMRARRLIAAGEIALRFQHSLNNPLAGILAEAQLMQLDSVTTEQNEALERIVALCRRIIELGRSLDGMGERK